ncbi:MAG: FtsX-like permease family protein [Tannerella sp.]|jgi:ABC-type lipoprotein release transport system permease subunit|nr:FtsX-like permease family protein [Tannerella sp.]
MILKLSWKNIWRNKTRSGVILGAIAIGLFAGTYTTAFMNGWMIGTVNDEVNTNMSHFQIRDTAFAANNDVNAFFNKSAIKKQKLEELNIRASYRLNINGMLSSANSAVGVRANGVNPEEEMMISTVWQTVPDTMGYFLDAELCAKLGKNINTTQQRSPIVISQKTATKLKVRLGSKIVLSFQDAVGEMQTMSFRVCGVFHTSNTGFDEGNVFVRYDDLLPVTALPDGAAHVAALRIISEDFTKAENLRAYYTNDQQILKKISLIAPEIKALFPDYEVKTWEEISPMLAMSLGWTDVMAVVVLGIFLLALAFGIINTMLMAVLERTRELGMLRAIGMSRRKVFYMIMLETVFLTLVGSIAGIIIATAVIIPSLHSGIDLTPLMGDTFEDFGYSSIIYPIINAEMFVEIIFLVIAAGILSAIYPARKALKLNPLEAIRNN